jgi:hypothetical protein
VRFHKAATVGRASGPAPNGRGFMVNAALRTWADLKRRVQMVASSRLRLGDRNTHAPEYLRCKNGDLPRLPNDEIPMPGVQIRGTYFPMSHGETTKQPRISQVSNNTMEAMCIFEI